MRGLVLLLLLVSSAAWAVKKGEPLYVRSRDAKVLESADLKSKVLTTLPLGTKVTWLGADATNRQLHKVELIDSKQQKLTGFVLQANLSPNAPAAEVASSDGKAIDAQAFKSSGAATKALGGQALEYAQSKNLTGMPERLIALEAISASVDARALAERARGLGLTADASLLSPAKGKPK